MITLGPICPNTFWIRDKYVTSEVKRKLLETEGRYVINHCRLNVKTAVLNPSKWYRRNEA